MTMPGDLLSGALIEVARDLREKRVTARELIEAAIAPDTSALASASTPIRSGRRSRLAPAPRPPMLSLPPE
jgi:hypothetical protein